MRGKSKVKDLPYPENLTYKRILKRKDPAEIALTSGFNAEHVRKVLRGERQMNDKILQSIEKILRRRRFMQEKIDGYKKITA